MEQKHTPEPWRVSGNGTMRFIDASVGNGMAQEVATCMRVEHGDMEANARRIVACVNACSGIATERLERHYNAGGGIDSAMEESALREQIAVYKQRDQLRHRVERAERALQRVGWTYIEGADEWKPPIGPSASPLLDRIDQLQAERDLLLAAATAAYELLKVIHDETGKVGSQLQAAIAAAKDSRQPASNLLTDAEVIAGLEEQRKELADMLREVLEGRPAGELEPMLAGIPMERYSRAIQVLERCAPQQEGGAPC